ncbi:MAG: folate-binding protein [Nitrosomonadales bacterium]|nr:MAG: folate-binding protein [Nitrosomonadales bacterium]
MNSAWQTYLQNHNAVIEDDCIAHYGDASTELKNTYSNTIIVDLSHFGLIHFSGEDAATFLQGQLSCDVRKIDFFTAKYGSCCTPKGRMLASFLIWQDDNGYFMQVPMTLLITLENRLSMFVLRSKVKLTDDSNTNVRIGIAGNRSAEAVKEIFGAAPSPYLGVIHSEHGSILCLAQNRFEIIATPKYAPKLWKHLRKYALPVGKPCWEWLEVKAGIPIITPATQERFVPQMANLEAIGGISFQKGCYPGQEIVSRTQYLSKLKRRMYLANIPTKEPVAAGDELYSDDRAKQSSGMIVNAAPSPEGGYDVLAVIQTESVEAEKIYWKTLNGPMLRIMPLPYLVK